jgi:nitrite reductase/ring-hydroxylating ferredoxin subunit
MTAISQGAHAPTPYPAKGLATVDRIELPSYPTGWYRVAAPADVPAGALVRMRWFGRELICWRPQSGGAPRVFDAYCAHMGAHIGEGGFVEGDRVVCPFHHWKYDCEGRNVEVPYRDKPQRGARQQVWPTIERNGMVLVWNDPEGREPDWYPPEVPEAKDPGFVTVVGEQSWTIHTHVQEILENAVDVPHFQFVHGVEGFGAVELVEDGPMFRATASVTMETGRGTVEGAVESELWGLGLSYVRLVGAGSAHDVFAVTPVDDETLVAIHTFFVPGDESGPSRYGKSFMGEFSKQIVEDIPIWESKRYRAKPRLATGENAVLDFRRWAGQFYPADEA